MLGRAMKIGVGIATASGVIGLLAAGSGRVSRSSLHSERPEEAAIRVERPPQLGRPFNAASRQEILDVARATPFDVRYGAGDQQRLIVGECADDCRYGPLADVQPAMGIHTQSEQELASGRFVGRMINHGPEAYSSLNLGATDTTYVWVDKAAGAWRAVLVPSSSGGTLVEKRLALETHVTQEPWAQPGARWLLNGKREGPWFACVTWGCCVVD